MKTALLICASNFNSGDFSSIPSSEKDFLLMKRLLEDPISGGFSEIKFAFDDKASAIREKIESFFSRSSKADLKLLYYSGHGLLDGNSDLFFAAEDTRKGIDGSLSKVTAIKAREIQEYMESDSCKQQVVILDCCYSGLFGKEWIKDDSESVSEKIANQEIIKTQFGDESKVNETSKRRVILTSCSPIHYSFYQDEGPSVYTEYIVKGVRTGEAALGRRKVITARDLHNYLRSKAEEDERITPKIYSYETGYDIEIFKAEIDPIEELKKEAEKFISKDEEDIIPISSIKALKIFGQHKLNLTEDSINRAIEQVKEPRKKRKNAIREYENFLSEKRRPLSEADSKELETIAVAHDLSAEEIQEVHNKYEIDEFGELTPYRKLDNAILYPLRNYFLDRAVPLLHSELRSRARIWIMFFSFLCLFFGTIFLIEKRNYDIVQKQRQAATENNVEECVEMKSRLFFSFLAFRSLKVDSDNLNCASTIEIFHSPLGNQLGNKISSLALNAEGTRLASGDALGNIYIWDLTEETFLKELEVLPDNPRITHHDGEIVDLAFTNKVGPYKLLFSSSGTRSGSIILWDLTSNREILQFEKGKFTNHLLIDEQDNYVVSATSKGEISIWNLSYTTESQQLDSDEAIEPSFSNTEPNSDIHTVELGDGFLTLIRKQPVLKIGENRCIIDMTISKGDVLTVGSYEDDTENEASCTQIGSDYRIDKYTLSPDNSLPGYLKEGEVNMEENVLSVIGFGANVIDDSIFGAICIHDDLAESPHSEVTSCTNKNEVPLQIRLFRLSMRTGWSRNLKIQHLSFSEDGNLPDSDSEISRILGELGIRIVEVSGSRNDSTVLVTGDFTGKIRLFMLPRGSSESLLRTLSYDASGNKTNEDSAVSSIVISDKGRITYIGRSDGSIEQLRILDSK